MSRTLMVCALVVVSCLASTHCFAVQFITNGGFETGDFTGWTVEQQTGTTANGDWLILDSTGPVPLSNDFFTPGPAGGKFYAVTDQDGGPNCVILFQSFTVAAPTKLYVNFDLWPSNEDVFTALGPLDFTPYPNQHCQVDLVNGGANAFSTAPADIVQNYYDGPPSTPVPFSWQHMSFTTDVDAGTYFLRFGEVDNDFFNNFGVDNVSVSDTPTVPEPSSCLFLLTAIPFGLRLRRK